MNCSVLFDFSSPQKFAIFRQRFWEKVERRGPEECWPWTASLNSKGYGQIWLDGQNWRAHRVSYILHYGDLPEGIQVCHDCDNRVCVNPAHLFPGTNQENCLNMTAKGRHGSAILTPDVALAIYQADMPFSEIAERFNVKPQDVQRIKWGVNWRWLTGHTARPKKVKLTPSRPTGGLR